MEAQKPAEREKEAGGDTAVKVGGKAVDFAKIDIPHAFEILKVRSCPPRPRAPQCSVRLAAAVSVQGVRCSLVSLHDAALRMQTPLPWF